MSGAKKCGPHLQCARHARDSQTHARASADARRTHAAQTKPPAQANTAARPATQAPVQPKRPPSVPPVYRPQPTPKVLQKKTPPGRPVENTRASAPRPAHSPARPSAPPVYRPEPKSVAQPKAAAGAHARPTRPATPQVKPAPKPTAARPAVPTAATPSSPSHVIQRMKRKKGDEDEYEGLEDHYGSTYWPPPSKPKKAPPSPTYNYYKLGAQYHTDVGEDDSADLYMDFFSKKTGKATGMTSGSGVEDEFDESYADIPIGVRPTAPSALWNKVYAGLKDSTTYTDRQWVKCEEDCMGTLYVDKKSKKETGTVKRPPMCHVVAYNHIKWGVSWLYTNRVKYNYSGPDMLGMPDDTWRALVWHKSNLRPGHASCNSKTASLAKGTPSSKDEKAAKTYVLNRLQKLKPNWF